MEWTVIWATLVGSIPAIIAALMAWLQSRKAVVSTTETRKVVDNADHRISNIHTQINGRLANLIESIRSEARAIGMAEGVTQERLRRDAEVSRAQAEAIRQHAEEVRQRVEDDLRQDIEGVRHEVEDVRFKIESGVLSKGKPPVLPPSSTSHKDQ